MKNWIVGIMLCLLVAGCGSPSTAAIGGALVGGAASHTFAGIEADLQKAKEAKLAQLEIALENLANTTDDVEKTALIAKIKALENTIQTLQDTQTGIAITKEGFGIDWKDAGEVGGYGGTILAALLAWYFRSKNKKNEAKYTAHKRGTELYTREHNEADAELYKNIGNERAKLGI